MEIKRRVKDYFLLFFKGAAMGGADVVPGVSGGTIAFITGIYEELIESINSIDLRTLHLLGSIQLKQFWAEINGNFLLTVFGGIFLSLFSLAKVISFLITNYPIQLWSFFIGLIIASAILVIRKINKWTPGVISSLIMGAVGAYFLTTFAPADTGESLISVFLSGMVAICAMILPGISGSFILLILGKYEMIIDAVKEMQIIVLLVFALGCVIGLLSFARAVAWILRNYHNLAVGLLSGFMLGSLNKIWPWKEILLYRLNSHGEQIPVFDRSILPNEYYTLTGNDPYFLQGILFMGLGIFIVVAIERMATWLVKSN